MDNKVLFRKAFQGFNKEDVVSYIEKISKDTNGMLAQKDAEIKNLTARNDECEKKACELSEKLAQNEEIIAQKDDEIKALKEKNAELEEMLAAQSAVQEIVPDVECEQKYQALLSEKENLQKQLEMYKEFESVQRDLGSIIIKAEKSAAEIIAKAKSEAEAVIADAQAKCNQITDRKIKACRHIADSFDKSKEGMDHTHHALCENLDTIKRAVEDFYSSLEEGNKIVHENVNTMTDTENL